jgi:hypothetical protein
VPVRALTRGQGRRQQGLDIWREFGACPLAFAEYLLIGVAGLLFPDDLLNDEGVNRKARAGGTAADDA